MTRSLGAVLAGQALPRDPRPTPPIADADDRPLKRHELVLAVAFLAVLLALTVRAMILNP